MFMERKMNITQKDKDRFCKKMNKSGDCWEWTASKDRQGYGYFGFRGKTWKSHRVSWVIHNGEIPSGLLVCHKCDHPSCVNPAHLFLGTHTDNMRDAIKKGRNALLGLKGEASPNSKLTKIQVLEIREIYRYRGNNNQRFLAKKYGVSRHTIEKAVNRKTWKHI